MTTHFVNLLDELMRRSLRMAHAVEQMLAEACQAALAVDGLAARRIVARDADIDQEEVTIEAETLRLMTLFQPMGSDMRQLCTILKVNNDLERIADCAVNIAERTYHLEPGAMDEFAADLREMVPSVRRMLRDVLVAYANADPQLATRVSGEDDVIDAFYGQFIRKVAQSAARSPEAMATHLDVLSIGKNLERVADHITNIAEDVIYLSTGRIVRHSTRPGPT